MKYTFKSIKEQLSSEITEVPPMLRASYLPSLDGFRGISILLVLIYHVQLALKRPFFQGEFGVEIFFVISGFIITTILLKEKVKKQTVSLKKFYIRRSLKIIPIAYLYLLFVIIVNSYYLHVHPNNFLSAALFIKNTDIIPTWPNGLTDHFWSLSVEEQFYLLFPVILASNTRRYPYVLLAFLAVLPVVLILEYKQVGVFGTPAMNTILDFFRSFMPILFGSLASVLIFKKIIVKRFYRNTIISNVLLLLLAYNLYIGINVAGVRVNTIWLCPVVIAMVIINNLTPSTDLFFKFLNSKLLVFVGVASYSLYVWQQVFILGRPWAGAFPYGGSLWLNAPLALIIGFASYYLIEIPLAKLKHKFR